MVVVVRGKGARGFHNSEGHFLGDTLSPCWAPATDLPVLADREVGPASLVAWQVPGSRRPPYPGFELLQEDNVSPKKRP